MEFFYLLKEGKSTINDYLSSIPSSTETSSHLHIQMEMTWGGVVQHSDKENGPGGSRWFRELSVGKCDYVSIVVQPESYKSEQIVLFLYKCPDFFHHCHVSKTQEYVCQ